jgi:hypothetical protein
LQAYASTPGLWITILNLPIQTQFSYRATCLWGHKPCWMKATVCCRAWGQQLWSVESGPLPIMKSLLS